MFLFNTQMNQLIRLLYQIIIHTRLGNNIIFELNVSCIVGNISFKSLFLPLLPPQYTSHFTKIEWEKNLM